MAKIMFNQMYKLWLLKQLSIHGNYKKVARLVNVSVSALSQSMKSLEDYLEKRLLIKSEDGFSLSQDGQALLEYFESSLEQIENYCDQQDYRPKKLILGAYDSLVIKFVPQLFSQLRERYQGIKLEVVSSRSSGLATGLRKGTLDMAIVIDKEETDAYFSDVIYTNELGVYVSQDVFKKYPKPIESLGLGTISSYGEGHPYFYTKFLKDCSLDQVPTVYLSDSFESIKDLVIKGNIVGILPKDVAQNTNEKLVKISPESITGEHTIELISRKTINNSFRDEVVSILKEILSQ